MVVEGLSAGYRRLGRRVPVLRDVSLTAPAGAITALLGANGAGKTTLLRVLLGALPPWEGSVLLGGHAPRVRRRLHGTAFLPDVVRVPPGWTVRAFLREGATMSGLKGPAVEEDVQEVLARTFLTQVAAQRLDRLSHGTARRAALAFALTGSPDILLLDEPLAGLDPPSRIDLRQLVQDVSARGTAVLMSSHDLAEVERIANHIFVLKDGGVATRLDWNPAGGQRLEEMIAW